MSIEMTVSEIAEVLGLSRQESTIVSKNFRRGHEKK